MSRTKSSKMAAVRAPQTAPWEISPSRARLGSAPTVARWAISRPTRSTETPIPSRAPLSPLPPFPVFSFRDIVALEHFELEGKLLPSRPALDFTKLFYERTHGRWKPRFKLKDEINGAVREQKERLKKHRKNLRGEKARSKVPRPRGRSRKHLRPRLAPRSLSLIHARLSPRKTSIPSLLA